jgi:protein disulfide-isomerase A1
MHKATKYALGLLAAAAIATASDVVQLKKDTFDDFVKTNDLVLAECKPPSRILASCRILTDRRE